MWKREELREDAGLTEAKVGVVAKSEVEWVAMVALAVATLVDHPEAMGQ